MSQVAWTGGAQQVDQLDEYTPSAPTPSMVFSITVNKKTVSYVATGSETAAEVIDAFISAWLSAPYGELAEITPSNYQDTTLRLTSSSPFRVSAALNWSPFAAPPSANPATLTAYTGPNDVANADNWRKDDGSAALPAATDEVLVAGAGVPDMLYNLDALTGIALNKFTRDQSYTGQIGLPYTNPAGYVEYRPLHLEVWAASAIFGEGTGTGPTFEQIDFGARSAAGNTATVDVLVHRTGLGQAEQGSLQIAGTPQGSTVEVREGWVALNRLPVIKTDVLMQGAASVYQTGGRLDIYDNGFDLYGGPPGLRIVGGELHTWAPLGVGSELYGGQVFAHGPKGGLNPISILGPASYVHDPGVDFAGAVILNHEGAIFDLSRNSRRVTVADLQLLEGRIIDPNEVLAATNATFGRLVTAER